MSGSFDPEKVERHHRTDLSIDENCESTVLASDYDQLLALYRHQCVLTDLAERELREKKR